MSSQGISIYAATLVVLGGLALGAVVALAVVGGSLTATDQTDPCFGRGQFVEGSTYFFTLNERAAVRFSKYLGIDMIVGEAREFRDCQVGAFDTVTIDVATGTVVGLFTDYGAIYDRAISPPQGTPEAIKVFEEALQDSFVQPVVPTDLTAGCDPSWVRTTFNQVQAVVCYPSGWVLLADDEPEGLIGGGTVEVGVLGRQTESHTTKCSMPTVVNVASGTARICALGPSAFVRVTY